MAENMDTDNAVILATAGHDHKIHFWQPPTGECLRTLHFSDSQVCPCVTCSPSTLTFIYLLIVAIVIHSITVSIVQLC